MKGKAKYDATTRRILLIFGIVLILFFGFILVCNLIVIVKSAVKPDEPPTLFGVMPMVVRSGSMSGDAEDHIEVDDLIFITEVNHEQLKVGDIVAYVADDKTIITHRIVGIQSDGQNELLFITKGDANNAPDAPVTKDRLIGVYSWRIPKIGRLVMFMQTPLGIVLAVGVPVAIFFAIEFVGRRKDKKRN